jgi:hypothetical protein
VTSTDALNSNNESEGGFLVPLLALAAADKTNVEAITVLKNNFLLTFFIRSTPIGF